MVSPPEAIFLRTIQHNGIHVERPLVFYVGLNKVGRVATTRLILAHGGHVVDHPRSQNSNIISLVDGNAKATATGPTAYSVHYIQACVDAGHLLDIEPFRRIPATSPGRKSPASTKRICQASEETPLVKHLECTASDNSAVFGREPAVQKADAEHAPVPGLDPPVDADTKPVLSFPHLASSIVKSSLGHRLLENENSTSAKSPEKGSGESTTPNNTSPKVPDLIQGAVKRTKNALATVEQPTGTIEGPAHKGSKSLKWSIEEDNCLWEFYEDAKDIMKFQNKSCSELRKLSFWEKRKRERFLPAKRSAEECFKRMTALLKHPTACKKQGSSKRPRLQKVSVVQRTTSSETESCSPLTPNTEVEKKQNVIQDAQRKTKMNNHFSSSDSSFQVSPVKKTLLKSRAKRAKDLKLFKLVHNLARKCGVSQRRAFRTLRNEQGHLNRTFNALRRKYERKST